MYDGKFTLIFLVIECGYSSLWDNQENIHSCLQNNRVSVREEKGINHQRSCSAVWLHGSFKLGSANPSQVQNNMLICINIIILIIVVRVIVIVTWATK